jgi:hypothetical protein
MNITAQMRELFIAYGLTAGGMLIGLLLMRADRRAYFRWPVYSVMVMALGVVLWNVSRKHLLPGEWVVMRASAMYYAALTLYFIMGLGIGTLLGRLTRHTGAGPGNRENSDMET